MQTIDPLHLCPECLVIKTPRSRHCSVCNQCIERYDHHCPWINNCVGLKNHRSFMLFLLCLITTILTAFVGTIIELVEITEDNYLDGNSLNYSLLPEVIMTNKVIYVVLMWVTVLITGLFSLPILLLFYI